jgi:outer membrane protein
MNRRFINGRSLFAAGLILAAFQANAQQAMPAAVHKESPAAGQSQQVYTLSLPEAIAFADKNNVQVKNALIDYKIQEQTNRNLTSTAYPQLSGNIAATYYPDVPIQSFPNFIAAGTYQVLTQEGVKNGNGQPIQSPSDFGFITAPFGTKWTASAGVTLSQVLFDGQVFVGLQARKTALDFARANTDVTRENIKYNVYKVYLQLVVSQTLMAQIDANIDRASKLLHDTRELFKNGFSEQLDVSRASVQLANLETQKVTTQRNIDNGYLGLKYLLGMPIKDSLVLTEKITEERILGGLSLEDNYHYEDRKEYQVLEKTDMLNQYNIKRYKATYLPTANLNSTFSKTAYRGQFDFFGKGDWFNIWNIGLSINVPIFDGFARASNLEKARLQQQQTKNQLEYLKLSIDNDVQQARNSYAASIVTLQSQKKNVDLATEVYDQTRKKYESGLGSTTDITTAQTDLITAQTNYVSAMYDAIIAKVDYFKAVGKLP